MPQLGPKGAPVYQRVSAVRSWGDLFPTAVVA